MNILVFAGTTEGRNISAYLAEQGMAVTASVATQYGAVVMPEIPGLTIRTGRLALEEMRCYIEGFELVIDATHPYAVEITRNISEVCAALGKEHYRLLRPSADYGGAVVVRSAQEAVAYLNRCDGNALITTGSKELEVFAGVENFSKRCFARVLPTVEAIDKCLAIGLEGKNIICMQGPFSHEMNLALISQTHTRYLVTKDSGITGGLREKLSAAKAAGITALVIARPTEETGYDCELLVSLLRKRLGITNEKNAFPKTHFPVFLQIAGEKAVIIGGGRIAARRAQTLASFGAHVTVIAPEICAEMNTLTAQSNVQWIEKEYAQGDLQEAALAICTTSDRLVNHQAAQEAKCRKIPVSVADMKDDGTFYFPAIVEGGGMVGGFISQGGENHRALRQKAEEVRRVLDE